MDDQLRLPPVFVVSADDADRRLRSAEIACTQARCGAVAFSCHWGPPEILVDCGENLELAARAIQLLRAAGLMQSNSRPESSTLSHARRRRPLIQISLPAHFGVDLMLLAGAALRALQDRQVAFIALCGTIDVALRNRVDSANLDDLKRYANQLPKHRVSDLYPLFCLIGASAGVARGVLDRVMTEQLAGTRRVLTGSGRPRDGNRVPRNEPHPLSPMPAIAIQ